jgi:hypothetical protein
MEDENWLGCGQARQDQGWPTLFATVKNTF